MRLVFDNKKQETTVNRILGEMREVEAAITSLHGKYSQELETDVTIEWPIECGVEFDAPSKIELSETTLAAKALQKQIKNTYICSGSVKIIPDYEKKLKEIETAANDFLKQHAMKATFRVKITYELKIGKVKANNFLPLIPHPDCDVFQHTEIFEVFEIDTSTHVTSGKGKGVKELTKKQISLIQDFLEQQDTDWLDAVEPVLQFQKHLKTIQKLEKQWSKMNLPLPLRDYYRFIQRCNAK